MNDRVAQYPNRYKLTPVSGDTYDLAPQPGVVTEAGTDLNKATLLKDTTAALYGLTSAAVPDDVLGKLAAGVLVSDGDFVDVLGTPITIPSAQLDERVRIAAGSYVGTGTNGSSNKNSIALTLPNTKIVIVTGSMGGIFTQGKSEGLLFGTVAQNIVTWSTGLLQWYSNSSAANQLNNSGETYYCMEIGI